MRVTDRGGSIDRAGPGLGAIVIALVSAAGCQPLDSFILDGSAPRPDSGTDVRVAADAGADLSRPDGGSTCGDGVRDRDEQCDRGVLNSPLPDAPCRDRCRLSRCGDGVLDSSEGCDDGNRISGDGCDNTCRLEKPSSLQPYPAKLSFGGAGASCEGARTRTIALHNATKSAIAVRRVSLVGCGSALGLRASQPSINSGGNASIPVTFTPASAATISCAVKVEADDGLVMVPVSARAETSSSQIDRFRQEIDRKVDVLLLVDGSGSMADERARLNAATTALAQRAQSSQADYQIGTVAISTNGTSQQLGALVGNPAVLTRRTPDLDTQLHDMLASLSSGAQERGLDALAAALAPPLSASFTASSCSVCASPTSCVSGSCRGPSAGFRRAGASLEVIVVTDEADQSAVAVDAALARLGRQVDPLLGQLARVHALLPRGSCKTGSHSRWTEMVRRTGGRLEDLCATDYVPAIKRLAAEIFGRRSVFALTRKASKITRVSVAGRYTTAVTFSEQANAIVFATPPSPGERVRIHYAVACR